MPEPISQQEPGIAAHDAAAPFAFVLTVSEPADVGPLFRRLDAIPDATITRRRSGPDDGELGVAEVLQLLVPSSAVLAVAIRTLPVFIKSRRSSLTVTVTRGDRSVTLTGENLDDPQKILEITGHLLGDE
ncbi:effector-associated constant component EACC1 [Nonomuraea bangladeshensis]